MSVSFDHLAPESECLWYMLNSRNSGISKDQFFASNLIDATDVLESDMQAVNADVVEFCANNGCYAALPPFEEGSFIDRSERRFVHWKVLEVQDDYFLLSMDHYPIVRFDSDCTLGETLNTEEFQNAIHSRCWYLSCNTIIKVKQLTSDEHVAMLGYLYTAESGKLPDEKHLGYIRTVSNGIKSANYIGGVVESATSFLPDDLRKIYKKGKYATPSGSAVDSRDIRLSIDATLATPIASGISSMLYSSTGPIIEMFVYINYMLSQKSTGFSTHRKISSAYLINPELTELRKERHFGKIRVISEKKPRSVNATNIQRIYTTPAWVRRSHIRHLASGKIVAVKSATCTRHNLGETVSPQVVYKV